MVAYLSKSDASEGFNQIIDFLNGSSLNYALTVNPNIYVSCIKQFWTTVVVKQVNDVTRLQALVDKKKVVVIEATIREALRLDHAEGVDYLPNEDIFAELARMGYEKPSTKLTVGKGFFRVETPLFEGMLVEQQGDEEGDADEHVEEVNTGDAAKGDYSATHGEVPTVADEQSIPSPTPPTPPPQPPQDIPSTSQDDKEEDKEVVDAVKDVEESKEDETEPAEVQEVVDVVTTAKLITEVITAAIVVAPSRRRKRVVIRDPEEESTTSIPAKTKSKDKAIDHVKRKAKEDPAVKKYQAMKRKPQTEAQARKNMMMYLKNLAGSKLDYFKGMSYDDIRPIFEAKFNSNVAFLLKIKEQIKEDENRALEDLEALWSLVKEIFSTAKPKNFSDEFLLTALGAVFEMPDAHAQIWKNQRSVHGQAKVKSWKLLESCGVQIITFTTTQLILLVERRYPLSRFTLDQMLNAVRLHVEEESEVSLEMLRFTRQQHQEGQLE
nr:xylulose kinase-1 [Tanacetum cinerariifolium]